MEEENFIQNEREEERNMRQFREETETSPDSSINDLGFIEKCKMACKKSKFCMRL